MPAAGQPRRRPAGNRPTKAATAKKRTPVRRREQKVTWSQPKPYDRRKLFLRLAAGAAVAVAFLLSFTIFFKVDSVNISGCEKYTPEIVAKASGIEIGDNLLSFGKTRAAGKIIAELPYVKEVRVGIKLPDTVNIDIVETAVSYAIESSDGSWWLMDASGKLLEKLEGTAPSGYTKVTGVLAGNPAVNAALRPTAKEEASKDSEGGAVQSSTPEERASAALEILAGLEKNNLMSDVTEVDVTALYDLRLRCGEQYEVRLGGQTELAYKLSYLSQVLSQLEDYQAGTIDLTLEEGRTARFVSN